MLHHLAEGKTLRATSLAMGIAYRTVEYFVVRIRKRFDCSTVKNLLTHPLIAQYLKKEKIKNQNLEKKKMKKSSEKNQETSQ